VDLFGIFLAIEGVFVPPYTPLAPEMRCVG